MLQACTVAGDELGCALDGGGGLHLAPPLKASTALRAPAPRRPPRCQHERTAGAGSVPVLPGRRRGSPPAGCRRSASCRAGSGRPAAQWTAREGRGDWGGDYSGQSPPYEADPTTRRAQGVDGISFTVRPWGALHRPIHYWRSRLRKVDPIENIASPSSRHPAARVASPASRLPLALRLASNYPRL